jgi:hypothetical protein
MDFVHNQIDNSWAKLSNKSKMVNEVFENIMYMIDQKTIMINREMVKLKEDVNVIIKNCK